MSRRAAGSSGRTRLGLLLAAALCVPGLLAVADVDVAAGGSGGAGPVSSNAYRATAGFTGLEYSVPFYGRLWSDHSHDQPDVPEAAATARAQYFAELATVERDGSGLDLSFAVEGQSEDPGYEACHPDVGCKDVTVRVTSEGLLYLYVPRTYGRSRHFYTHLGGFPRRSVELSASDAGSGLKVYREVTVGPPPAAAGCEDYGDNTPEAYTCLFLRELLPPGQAADADVETLRAALPPLVQDSENYRLVFAEEFNGDPPAADDNGCRDGLSTLDGTVWNYFDACDNVDSRGEPCGNVAGGGFTMAVAGTCGSSLLGPSDSMLLSTFNHFHMKYGYVEFQYTFNSDQWPNVFQNLNLVLYTAGLKLRYMRDQYGVEIDDWEDWLKHSEVEVDVFEATRHGGSEIAHQYANWDNYDDSPSLRPIRTLKWTDYCNSRSTRSIVVNPNSCQASDTFTVTRGIEWTPRGYRTYIRAHGIQADLTLVPKNMIHIQRKHNGRVASTLSTRAKEPYFEYLVPGDTGTLLEQVGVAHTPLPFSISAWSYMSPELHPYIRKRLTFDYIRVWQPENLYTDMEPVYQ